MRAMYCHVQDSSLIHLESRYVSAPAVTGTLAATAACVADQIREHFARSERNPTQSSSFRRLEGVLHGFSKHGTQHVWGGMPNDTTSYLRHVIHPEYA